MASKEEQVVVVSMTSPRNIAIVSDAFHLARQRPGTDGTRRTNVHLARKMEQHLPGKSLGLIPILLRAKAYRPFRSLFQVTPSRRTRS